MPAIDPITANLNEEQRRAVEHTAGPLLILAGAGSGKTRALTHRIARLMHDDVEPWQILAVTFTNRAATEMKERIKKMLSLTEGAVVEEWGGRSGRLPVMGTFHSVCARILRRDIDKLGRDRSFVIYDDHDQESLMKNILKDMGIDAAELKPRAALSHIGRFKSEAVNPKEAQLQATTERMQRIIDVYKRYERALKEANALDFDDLILEAVRLFHEVPQVLDRYQETWRYLHVDEYQDTNHAQYLFITLLARKYRNLCVIGDPDQSIYAFRGADIRNILEFRQEYPDACRIKLEQNYRSTKPILDSSNAIIRQNPRRPPKEMWTEREEGPKIVLHEVRDERAEAVETLKSVEKMHASGVRLSEQVILYRTNAQSRLFEEACMRSSVPYRILGGVKFYARREVKDVLAYFHVILNSHDTLSLLRIINVPLRKIGKTTLERLQQYGAERSLPLWNVLNEVEKIEDLGDPVKARLQTFVDLLKDLRRQSETLVVAELLEKILSATDMEKWLKDDTEEGETRWQNVLELLSVTHKYDGLAPRVSLTSFLEEVALVSEVDKLTEARDDALTLMTLHLCKGLEFEHVIIAGCEEGIFPHANSFFDKEQLEEERRLMYVGMTRAKTHLTLFCARNRMLWGQQQANAVSRFLDDLPDEHLERRSDELLSAFAWASLKGHEKAVRGATRFDDRLPETTFPDYEGLSQEQLAEGARIEHPTFGPGTLTALRGDIADIVFDSGERKSFALSIAPLKLL